MNIFIFCTALSWDNAPLVRPAAIDNKEVVLRTGERQCCQKQEKVTKQTASLPQTAEGFCKPVETIHFLRSDTLSGKPYGIRRTVRKF